jgi:hypothetical protein
MFCRNNRWKEWRRTVRHASIKSGVCTDIIGMAVVLRKVGKECEIYGNMNIEDKRWERTHHSSGSVSHQKSHRICKLAESLAQLQNNFPPSSRVGQFCKGTHMHTQTCWCSCFWAGHVMKRPPTHARARAHTHTRARARTRTCPRAFPRRFRGEG